MLYFKVAYESNRGKVNSAAPAKSLNGENAGKSYAVTFSMRVLTFLTHPKDIEMMLKLASKMLYRVKTPEKTPSNSPNTAFDASDPTWHKNDIALLIACKAIFIQFDPHSVDAVHSAVE